MAIKDGMKAIGYVGLEVFTAVVIKCIIFWHMTPCSPLSFNRRFGGLSPPSTLKMEAIYSSETSVDTQRTTRRHIPEDDTLQSDMIYYLHGAESTFPS
jgi:hypothetical protein